MTTKVIYKETIRFTDGHSVVFYSENNKDPDPGIYEFEGYLTYESLKDGFLLTRLMEFKYDADHVMWVMSEEIRWPGIESYLRDMYSRYSVR